MRAPFSAQPCATRLLMTAGGAEDQNPKPKNKDAPGASLWSSAVGCSSPLCLCREAQRQADQETRMFERSEFARLPPDASIAGCPGAAGVTDTRVAFFLVPFLWRDKEKELRRREHIPAQPSHEGESRSSNSDLDLRAQLHHRIVRQVQELGRRTRVVVHLREQLFTPGHHALAHGGDHDVAR